VHRGVDQHLPLSGAEISSADVTAYTGVELARFLDLHFPPERSRVVAWCERLRGQPSTALARYV